MRIKYVPFKEINIRRFTELSFELFCQTYVQQEIIVFYCDGYLLHYDEPMLTEDIELVHHEMGILFLNNLQFTKSKLLDEISYNGYKSTVINESENYVFQSLVKFLKNQSKKKTIKKTKKKPIKKKKTVKKNIKNTKKKGMI